MGVSCNFFLDIVIIFSLFFGIMT
jgi:hypothetical protein